MSARIWATQTKNGRPFGKDYFDELLERIRASERRAYQKIADVFEQCSSDYSPNSEETKIFYAFVQNKELCGLFGVDTITYCNDGIKVIMIGIIDFSVLASMCKYIF